VEAQPHAKRRTIEKGNNKRGTIRLETIAILIITRNNREGRTIASP
jgi:hypothetical protein